MGENKRLEYKETINSNTFLKTVSAYANYGGGKILFGISDDGEILGIQDPVEAKLNLENKINDSIRPVPEYALEIQEGDTISLTVFEGMYKPYMYKGKAYKRNDTATIEVDRLEYSRLILEGQGQSFEELPALRQELTFSRLEEELVRVLEVEKLDKDILKTLELYSERKGYNNAAALLADRNDFKGVDMIRFGKDIDEIMDRESVEQVSLLIQLEKSMGMYRKYYQYEKIEGVERRTIEKIPEKAYREAIANALVHRAWDVKASIKVSMFEDRIEISSPGGLPAELSADEYVNGQVSILRNPIIGNVFFRLKYIEKFGTGILRINHLYRKSIKKPDYKVFENSIKVVLPVMEELGKFTEMEVVVWRQMQGQKEMTRVQIERNTGIKKDTLLRILNGMIEKGFIQKTGAGRGTKYIRNVSTDN